MISQSSGVSAGAGEVAEGPQRRRLPRVRLVQGSAVRQRGWRLLFGSGRNAACDAYVLADASQGGMRIVGEWPESAIGTGRRVAFRICGEGLRSSDVGGRVVWVQRPRGSLVAMGIAFEEKEMSIAARLALWHLARARKGMAGKAR